MNFLGYRAMDYSRGYSLSRMGAGSAEVDGGLEDRALTSFNDSMR